MEIRIKVKPSIADKYALLNDLLEMVCDHVNKYGDVSAKMTGR